MTFARNLTEARERRESERAANLRALCTPSRTLTAGSYAGGVSGEVVGKECVVRSEEYRRLVAAMPCKHCGIYGYSQAAHPNTGKGGGIKTDDRDCFPLCTVHPGAGGGFVRGCHERFDQGALYPKAIRREIEPAWSADTRRAVIAAGNWPKNLPAWDERATQLTETP